MKKVDFFKQIILYVLCILIFLRFFLDGITYPFFNCIFVVSVFFLFIFFVLINSMKIDIDRSDFFLFLFFLFSIFSSLFSEIKGTGVRFNSYIGSYLFLFLLLKNIITEENKKYLINAILIATFFISIYGIYQRFWGLEETRRFIIESQQVLLNQYPNIWKYISPTFLDRIQSNRIFATFIYPNIYAGFLISIMPFLFFIFLKNNKKLLGNFSIFLFFLCFFNLLLTESTGAILIFIFVFHIILLQILFDRKKLKKILSVLLLSELFFFIMGYKFKILPHIHSLIDRIYYWKISIKIISINPVLGVGPENFQYYFLKFKTPKALEAKHAHSLFFETFVENGVIGVFLLFYFFVSIILKSFKSKKDKLLAMGIFYLLFSFLLHNLVDFDFSDPSLAIIFFIFASIIENKKESLPLRLTKFLLYFIIIIGGLCNIKLIKLENSERCRKYSESEKNLNIKIYYLEKAEKWDNKNFEVFLDKGDVYLNIWKFSSDNRYWDYAILNYKNSISLNPYLTRAYRKMGYLYEEIENYKMAEKMYLELIKIYPNKKLYNLDLARFYKKIGEKEKFEYFYRKSKDLIGMTIEEGIVIEEIEKWIKSQK